MVLNFPPNMPLEYSLEDGDSHRKNIYFLIYQPFTDKSKQLKWGIGRGNCKMFELLILGPINRLGKINNLNIQSLLHNHITGFEVHMNDRFILEKDKASTDFFKKKKNSSQRNCILIFFQVDFHGHIRLIFSKNESFILQLCGQIVVHYIWMILILKIFYDL